MFGRISINGSVELLGVPDFHRIDGPALTANILDPCPSWGDGGSDTNLKWWSQSGGAYGIVSVPWNRPFCVLPVYHCSILENTRAASVTISFEVIVWRACKVSLLDAIPSSIGGSIDWMMTGMVRLINNFCWEFLLEVSVSVTFLFFLLLVWVATNWLICASLSASSLY